MVILWPKVEEYTGEHLSGGYWSKCVPLVFEHSGSWDSEAEIFYKMVQGMLKGTKLSLNS